MNPVRGALHTSAERHFSMGKSIALLFACAALVILAGSFVARGSIASIKGECAPTYGVDPCTTGSIDTSSPN